VIVLLWTWMVSGAVAATTALLALLRMRNWWSDKIMRSLVVFLVGVVLYAMISVYLSGTALGGPRATLDRALSDPALWGIELLTIGQLCMLLPAILLAAQLIGVFDPNARGDTGTTTPGGPPS
jgi:hypothetical protein